jgi:hypothetical protein
LAGGVGTGLVQLWGLDPKGGMELGIGRPMFARFAGRNFHLMADLLEEAARVAQDRAERLAGETRQHQPTLAEPLIVLVIDELANLTAYLTDRQLCDRIPQTTPGVGYVTLEGDPTPMPVRLTYLSDEHIRDIARTYGRLRVIDGETAGGAA